jgi:hypothetical protein
METWPAGQIGQSNGAYSGRRIRFTFDHELVDGTLDRSDRSVQTSRTILMVNGNMYWVENDTPVEVH